MPVVVTVVLLVDIGQVVVFVDASVWLLLLPLLFCVVVAVIAGAVAAVLIPLRKTFDHRTSTKFACSSMSAIKAIRAQNICNPKSQTTN